MTMRTGLNYKLEYDDLANFPDDGYRYELLDGDLMMTPAPNPRHQEVCGRLYLQLVAYFQPRGGRVFFAPLDMILTKRDVFQPDLLVVTDPALITNRAVEGAPAIAVEVLSPSTADRDRTAKPARYAALGVRHYWIVDPDRRRMECYRERGGTYELVVEGEGSALLDQPDWPGLTIDLGQLWS